jgi:Zn-dependent protease with chaperone function
MSTVPKTTKPSFVKRHVLPVLLVFLIPGFSVWFFSYAEKQVDAVVLHGLESALRENKEVTAENRELILTNFQAMPLSAVMASSDPRFLEIRAMFADMETTYATFRWMKYTAWACLAVVGITFLFVGMSVAFSLRSQAAQYYSLRIGWPVLQLSAAIQVLGQAALLVALSYWVTAIFAEVYYVKLVGVAGLLAIGAVFLLWKAIFGKPNQRLEVNGQIVSETDAPSLWQRSRDLAAKLNTAPPNQIVAGIEPSFFVTQHPVVVGDEIHHGRTLYVSLPMLKVLEADEAEAVLGHELAHFSGEDTMWARKISPLTSRFAHYMETLAHGIGIAVAHFMLFFWKLYGLSINRLSRIREFRADAVGAQLVSKDAMKRALVKTTAYCDYRHETEFGIVTSEQVDRNLNLPQKLAEGYPAFLHAFASCETAPEDCVPHPFDTHPTLQSRLAQLGFEAKAALSDESIHRPAQTSWYHAIATAPQLEERMWAERQQTLETVQAQDLAWRIMPKTEEELGIVLEHFPRATFRHKDGTEALLEHDRIYLSSWDGPILFNDIVTTAVEDTLKGQRLTISHRQAGADKPVKTKIYAAGFGGERGDLLSSFTAYYSRHQQAELWSQPS